MLFVTFKLLFLSLFVLVAGKAVKFFIHSRWKARESAQRGCRPPPTIPSKGFFGIKTLTESIKATNEERSPQFISDEINRLGKDCHTCRVQIFDSELLFTRDVENVKAMFTNQSGDWDIGLHRQQAFFDLFGPGVLTNRGQNWKHSRALVRPQFAREQLKDVELFETHVQALIRGIEVGSDGWTQKLDLSPMFFDMTLDVATEFLVGQSVHNQTPELQAKLATSHGPNAPNLAEFGDCLDHAKTIVEKRNALAKYNWLLNSKEYPRARDIVRNYVQYFVDRELEVGNAVKDEEHGTPSKFVLLRELARETNSADVLRDELLNVLGAARDTAACLAGWVFYFLARHPDVYAKLRREILSAFPNDTVEETTFVKIWSTPYLLAVVNETLRHAAVVPLNERTAVNDTTLPTGGGPDGTWPIFVPKGNQVLVPLWSMQHREDIWGPDAFEYRPERWEDRKFGWDFIPFGGGARQCLGQQFARTQVMYSVVRLVHKFDKIENLEPPGPAKYHVTVENRSGTGVQVRLHAANHVVSEK